MDQMKEDDSLDAALTKEGVRQAKEAGEKCSLASSTLQLIVSSPLSRCLDTADLFFPGVSCSKVVLEEVREINGLLLNGQRRKKSVLAERYPEWDFSRITNEEDSDWSPDELEDDESVVKRGLKALNFIWEREETEIAVVAHGGWFRKVLGMGVVVEGGVERFNNCELKEMTLKKREGGELFLENKRVNA
eukprot:CAMPEP_0118658006 /NCGR_PEP_ID=MMETSP0785-20121206/14327_1 /TAXON_ID=91992 /ORGANISM="Bolidomonas pacifica, Strain CCMP 1866" /LENGTH=189 /DNA_ID=CAMNT_0006550973 /DNA_START=23 /DNA_END=592 /DNA_ORIENTATION=+